MAENGQVQVVTNKELFKRALEKEKTITEDEIRVLERKKKEYEESDRVTEEDLERIKKEINEMEERKETIENIKIKRKDLAIEKKKFDDNYISGIELAKLNATHYKNEKQQKGKKKTVFCWRIFFASILLSSIISGMFLRFSYTLIAAFFVSIIFVASCIRIIPEKQEWVIEFLGKYLSTWEAGLHLLFPLVMVRKARVYMGVQAITLYLDNKSREGKTSAKVDFLNASAEVTVELFYRIFNSYNAVYEVDNMVSAISEKMESGIRAYYGRQTIDQAIEGRAEVDLRKIIIQNATESDVFKKWGVEIVSLAVTDINLPTEVEDVRILKLKAEKKMEVTQIEDKIAAVEAEIAQKHGQADGRRLREVSTVTGIPLEEIIKYDLSTKRLFAYEKAGILIVGDSSETGSDAKTVGAIAGAAAHLGSQAAKEKKGENNA